MAIIDLRKTGPQGYRQLQQQNDLSGVDDETLKFLEDLDKNMPSASTYDPSKEFPIEAQSSVGNFGQSYWDPETTTLEGVRKAGDIRANNQWAIAKLGAGIGKGAVLAGTTFLDGTLGLVYGIGTAIDEGRFSGLWNNDVSNALQEINQKSEEWMPNYRTEVEQNRPWYQNLGTMNFWADTFIKNLGFTVGAMYSGKLWAAPLQIAKIPAVTGEVVGSTLSAINEGRIEANNNVRDWKELQVAQVEDAYQRAVSELNPDDAMYQTNLALLTNNRDRQLADIEDRSNAMGAGILLANTVLLSYTNFKTFGKIYSGGFKKAVKDFADTEKRKLAGRVAREGGRYVFNEYTKREGIKQGLRTAAREGLEEMNQAWIAETAGNYQVPDSPDAYYTAMLNPNSDIKTRNFLQAATEGFMNTYGTLDRYDELVIGGLTGLLGVPTVGRMENASANTYLGRNKWIGLSGGLFGEISTNAQRNEIGKTSVDIMNKYADRISNQKDYFVQSQSFIDAMDRWSKDNNAFEYKNAEDNDDFAAISAYARVGKLSDLRQLVNKDYDNLSDEDLERIAGYTSKDSDDPTVPTTQGWRDADGNYLSETPEGRAEMRKSLSDRRDVLLKNIDKYVDSVEAVRGLLHDSPQVTEDQINELAWLNWKLGRFEDRFKELKEENKPLISDYIEALGKYKEYLDEEYKKMYDAAPDDSSRADDKYIKENRNIDRSITSMVSFLTELQKTDKPLALASFIKDNNEFLSAYLGESGFELFGNLAKNAIQFEELKRLHNNLLDLSKMATASEQFNQRYKEFVNNPGAILENRQKIEKAVNQTKSDAEAAEMDTRLIDDLEGTVEEVGLQTVLDTYEAASEISPERQKLIDDAEAFAKANEDLANVKERVMRALNDIDATQQVKNDVRTLINIAGSRDEIFAIDSVLYTDIDGSPLYNETDFQGMSNDEIRSKIEERLTNVREAISNVESLIDTDDNIMGDIDQNLLSNAEAQMVEMTGNDETVKVPDVDAFEEGGAPNVNVPEQDLNYFTALLETSTPDDVQKLSSIINTINNQINSGKEVSDILETLKASKDYKALTDKYPIDDIITQYAIDKTSITVDRNPLAMSGEDLTSDAFDKKVEASNNSELSQNKVGEVKQYWSPIQGMLPIHTNPTTVPETRYYQIVRDGIDVLQIHLAVGAGGNFVPVNVVVIQAHEHRLFTVNPQLGCQTVCRGGFSRGAGPRQQHRLGAPGADHIRHLGKPLFMEGLVHPDQLPNSAGNRQLVEIRHIFALHQPAPPLPLGEDAKQLGHGRKPCQLVRLQLIGVHKEEAAVSRQHIPHGEIPGGGGHFAEEIVRIRSVAVFTAGIPVQPGQEPGLVLPSLGPVPGDGRVLFHIAAQKGNVLPDNGRHLLLEPGGGKILRPSDGYKHAGAQGAVHGAGGLGPQLAESQEHDELGRADIHIPSGGVPAAQQVNHPLGGRHGPAHGGPVPFPVLFPQGDIVEGKYLSRNSGRQRPGRQQFRIQPRPPYKRQKALFLLRQNLPSVNG